MASLALSIGDLLLETTRRAYRAQLAGGVDHHCNRIGVLRLCVANVANKTAVIYIVTLTSDGNDVARRPHSGSGLKSYGDIAAASGASECGSADSSVVIAAEVGNERAIANCHVTVAGVVATEGAITDRRIVVTGSIEKERKATVGRIEVAGAVVLECTGPGRRIAGANRVEK